MSRLVLSFGIKEKWFCHVFMERFEKTEDGGPK